jgi:DNA-binding transcriptional ArsR family regulator
MSAVLDPSAVRSRSATSVDVFAALGDPTRLALVARLSRGGPMSLRQLTAGADITRQAVRKHLDVLARAGLVRGSHRGRRGLWTLQHRPLEVARRHLEVVSKRWDHALDRLRTAVER